MTKFLFITGGVVSGIGKGIIAASIGKLLKNHGLKIFIQKFDPYFNIKPGLMSPLQHGEIFITKDGGEVDLDLGHYERFIDISVNKNSNITAGDIYSDVFKKEKKNKFLGQTIQIIPHIVNEIKNKFYFSLKKKYDVAIIEIGGTVGDIESLPFFEAARQLYVEKSFKNVFFIHITLIPTIIFNNELKTKPLQHSNKILMSHGIKADLLITRCNKKINNDIKKKIALFCNVNKKYIFNLRNTKYIYELPIMLKEQNLDKLIIKKINLKQNILLSEKKNCELIKIIKKIKNCKKKIKILFIAEYAHSYDAYFSVNEALKHAGYKYNTNIIFIRMNTIKITFKKLRKLHNKINGVVVVGDFNINLIKKNILIANYARINNIPIIGISFGMQIMFLEFLKNIIKIDILKYLTKIFSKCKKKTIGELKCHFKKNSFLKKIYKNKKNVLERHNHSYEINIKNKICKKIKNSVLCVSGINKKNNFIETIELKKHIFYIGCQYHPEFNSKLNKPHVLFENFIKTIILF